MADVLAGSSQLHGASSPFLTPVEFPQQLRLFLAEDIAGAFFVIFGTSWYNSDWGLKQVKLCYGMQGPSRECMLECPFPSSRGWAFGANIKQAFLKLAICLVELCFGKRLQDHEMYVQLHASPAVPQNYIDEVVARKWSKEVQNHLDAGYAKSVNACLRLASPAVMEEQLEPGPWQEAHDAVMQLLRETVAFWKQDTQQGEDIRMNMQ